MLNDILAIVRQPTTLTGIGLVVGAGVYWFTKSPELSLTAVGLLLGTVSDNTATVLARMEALEDAVRSQPAVVAVPVTKA